MGKRSPAPPPTPDYAAIARQQGQENIEAARQSAYMSNPNVYTPTASQTVSWQKTPQFNQTGYDKALAEFRAQSAAGVEGIAEPDRETFTSYIEQPTVRQELTGEAKNIFDIQQQAEKAMASLGQRELGDLSQYLNKDFAAQLSPILTGYGDYGTTAGAPNLAAYGQAGGVAAGTGGTIEGAPSAAGYAPTRSFTGPALQGEFATRALQGQPCRLLARPTTTASAKVTHTAIWAVLGRFRAHRISPAWGKPEPAVWPQAQVYRVRLISASLAAHGPM